MVVAATVPAGVAEDPNPNPPPVPKGELPKVIGCCWGIVVGPVGITDTTDEAGIIGTPGMAVAAVSAVGGAIPII